MLCGLEDDRLLEWSAVQQLCFTGPALLLVIVNSENKNDHPQQIERPTLSGPAVVDLNDEKRLCEDCVIQSQRLS